MLLADQIKGRSGGAPKGLLIQPLLLTIRGFVSALLFKMIQVTALKRRCLGSHGRNTWQEWDSGWMLKCQPQHIFLLPIALDMIKTLARPFLREQEHLHLFIHPPRGPSYKLCYEEAAVFYRSGGL